MSATVPACGPLLSIVTPAYNEAQNLPILRARLRDHLDALGVSWEWIVVDDHSSDAGFDLVSAWAREDPRIRGVRLSRNCGSHAALACGLELARGQATVLLAADLQDPPEIVAELVAAWRDGARVVWAIPQRRGIAPLRTLYYALLRRGEGLAGQALEGGDAVLLDRSVAAALGATVERHTSLFARIRLAGFRQASIHYQKAPRLAGRSGWTLRSKFKLALDSLTGFDHGLVRAMTYLGLGVACSGFALAGYVIWHALRGAPPTGWASIMTAILILGGVQMIFLGMLGEYAWRTLDAARQRPLYVVEASTGEAPTHAGPGAEPE